MIKTATTHLKHGSRETAHGLKHAFTHPFIYGLGLVVGAQVVVENWLDRFNSGDPTRHNILQSDATFVGPAVYVAGRGLRAALEAMHVPPKAARVAVRIVAPVVGFGAVKVAQYAGHVDTMPGGITGINIGEELVAAAGAVPAAIGSTLGMGKPTAAPSPAVVAHRPLATAPR